MQVHPRPALRDDLDLDAGLPERRRGNVSSLRLRRRREGAGDGQARQGRSEKRAPLHELPPSRARGSRYLPSDLATAVIALVALLQPA